MCEKWFDVVIFFFVLTASANANGHQEEEQAGEPEKEIGERSSNLESAVSEDGEPLAEDVSEATANEQASGEVVEPADAKEVPDEDAADEKTEEPPKETQELAKESTEQDVSARDKQPDSVDTASHNEEVPSNKVLIVKLPFCQPSICCRYLDIIFVLRYLYFALKHTFFFLFR